MAHFTAGQTSDLAGTQPNVGFFLDPAEACEQLGLLLFEGGRVPEAANFLRRAAELQQTNAAYLCNLAVVLATNGSLDEAILNCRRAIAIQPDLREAYLTLATALRKKGQLADAAASLRQAISVRPDVPEFYNDLGVTMSQMGELDEAIAAYRQAIALKPDYVEARFNLGTALKQVYRLQEAEAALRTALGHKPEHAQAHNNLGNVLRLQGRLDEALGCFEKAISLQPDEPEAHVNRGAVLHRMLQLDDAAASYRRAIELAPGFADAHFGLSMVLLQQGSFDAGWREYEWRMYRPEWCARSRLFPQPLWDGSDLSGKRILLHAEQGFGDAIQFVRYAPMVKQRGGQVTLLCPRELKRLLTAGLREIAHSVSQDEPLPPFDVHAPLMSLPRLFGATVESIPAQIPYLFVDPVLVDRWRSKFTDPDGRFRVGLVWNVGAHYTDDAGRSMQLDDLHPISRVPGIRLFSLQTGHAAVPIGMSPIGAEIVNWMGEVADFADTAALIQNLDLVIAIDTAVAHLAGALGKPVWVALPFAGEWRWFTDRLDTPWYPTMRLFRQKQPGKWDEPIASMAAELQRLVSLHAEERSS